VVGSSAAAASRCVMYLWWWLEVDLLRVCRVYWVCIGCVVRVFWSFPLNLAELEVRLLFHHKSQETNW